MTTQNIPLVAPEGFSIPEFLVFSELERRGFQHNVDFSFQSRFFGGRLDKGGLVVDFTFANPPDLAINVQGVFYHYEQGIEQKASDILSAIQIAAQGITLIFIDDNHVLEDVQFYVGAALEYKDYSQAVRGFA